MARSEGESKYWTLHGWNPTCNTKWILDKDTTKKCKNNDDYDDLTRSKGGQVEDETKEDNPRIRGRTVIVGPVNSLGHL